MNKNDYCNLDSSYLLEVNQTEKQRFANNESSEKQKYINNNNSQTFSRGIIMPKKGDINNNDNIEIDSFLRYPPNLYQNKTSIELKSNLDHNKFDLLYSNQTKKQNIPKKNKNMAIINDKPYVGAGRGIGDLDISELIRTGQDTRRYNDEYKEKQESNIINRFDILDKDYQDPKNVIMDIPRGGIQTRKIKKNKKPFGFKY
jgi:hypothetical protein